MCYIDILNNLSKRIALIGVQRAKKRAYKGAYDVNNWIITNSLRKVIEWRLDRRFEALNLDFDI